jgi:hypothetical protein
MTEQTDDRRQFSRILFDAWVELRQGEKHWHAAVVDLSLRGLLVEEPQDWQSGQHSNDRALAAQRARSSRL